VHFALGSASTPLCQWLEKENEGYPKKCLKQRQQWSLDCFGVGLNTSPKPIPVVAVDRLTRGVTLYISFVLVAFCFFSKIVCLFSFRRSFVQSYKRIAMIVNT